jgi:alkanesulfonate monooxygenase SsuD/methylene tetrahydromethanopterin reductase-like flavin-dependent oxidoreductase (luciferase family)
VAPDRQAGTYANPAKVHHADHRGEWFQVRGPLVTPPPPQGHPVLIQAGASGAFQDPAARNAEEIFAAYPDLGRAKDGDSDFKRRVEEGGRSRDAVKV